MKHTATIQRLIGVLAQAFEDLGLNVGTGFLESLALMIDRAMSGEGRYYHTTEHALGLTNRDDPIQTIAALFHDLVYIQVDQGIPLPVWSMLEPFLVKHGKGGVDFSLVDGAPLEDLGFLLAKDIFGFSGGHALETHGGSNEFLSSLVMTQVLQDVLPQRYLVQVIAYIQATIPFRPQEVDGIAAFDVLAHRLKQIAGDYHIPFSQVEIENTVQGAVAFANQDVENFTNPDPSLFLQNTWRLLPEINPALRRGCVYSLRDYRQALQAMEAFIHSIKPEHVLHEYKGVPSNIELKEKLQNVRGNLIIAYEYLAIKLVTVAILEALAEISGGDGPISSFIGDVDFHENSAVKLKSSMSELDMQKPETDLDRVLYRLLETGRRGPVDNADVRMAPISMLIYKYSGQGKIHQYLGSAKEMFAGKIKPLEFISRLDGSMLAAVIEVTAQTSPSVREKLMGSRLDTLK